MPKYFQVIKITFQEYFVYRLNFVLWRFRSFVFFLTLLFFWLAIYSGRTEFLGYQRSQMLVYVVGIAFLRSIVLGSRSADLAGQIKSGALTKLVLRPMNIFSYSLSIDFADKFLNIFFTIFEIGLVLSILKLPLYFPQKITSFLAFLIIISLAVFLSFFIGMFLSITAFWTEEVWATRFLFWVIILEFFAGAFFPIDVLPSWLQNIIYLTPFPYLVFFPIKIWLEQLSPLMIMKAMMICSFWLIIFFWLAHLLWRKGVKNYGAYGG
jgi:ABC-2 type transport system permease protein